MRLIFLKPLLLGAFVCLYASVSQGATHRPFPNHTRYTAGAIKPSNRTQAELDAATLGFYRDWKQKYIRSAEPGQLYVFANAEKAFGSTNIRSVSEAHGYGMIVTVLMAGADPKAQEDFDALFRFFRAHPTELHPELMSWRQVAKGGSDAMTEGHEDNDSATDADLDIAYSLLLADQQWGSGGEIDYKAEALKTMRAILQGDCDHSRHTLMLGDWVDDESRQWGGIRSSDFMPDHLKAFAAATLDPRWAAITDTMYKIFADVVADAAPDTGLLPDFIVPNGEGGYMPAKGKFLEGSKDGCYGYNACRDPWRIGTDYLLSGDPRALALLRPLNAWIQSATGGDPKKINAGYALDGRALSEDRNASFVGPFAVAAMTDAGQQKWLDALWDHLVKKDIRHGQYFGNTVKLQTMIVLSGNWW